MTIYKCIIVASIPLVTDSMRQKKKKLNNAVFWVQMGHIITGLILNQTYVYYAASVLAACCKSIFCDSFNKMHKANCKIAYCNSLTLDEYIEHICTVGSNNITVARSIMA
jgi:uncharacterized membrane protein